VVKQFQSQTNLYHQIRPDYKKLSIYFSKIIGVVANEISSSESISRKL